MRYPKKLFLAFLLLISAPVHGGEIVILIHGYASGAYTWEFSGINAALHARGWQHAGMTSPVSRTAVQPVAHQDGERRIVVVELPAHAPLMVQNHHLQRVLYDIRRLHPQDELTLVGHSAGGVVARLAVINNNPHRVARLISIASPHLGTGRALQGLDIVESKPFFCPGPGFDLLKSFVGGDSYDYLEDSRGALIDLMPAESGNLLAWLNHQPHPDIEYHAIVRHAPLGSGDEIVPGYSQDMNNVPALRGRATVSFTAAGHGLNPGDGALLAELLAE